MSDPTVPKHISSNHARAKEAGCVQAWYAMLTLVKQFRLCESSVLGPRTRGLVGVYPKKQCNLSKFDWPNLNLKGSYTTSD